MRKIIILLFFCFLNISIGYSRVFIQITGNPAEKISTEIIIQGTDNYSKVFTHILKQDLLYSDSFSVLKAQTKADVNSESLFKKLAPDIKILITGKILQKYADIKIYKSTGQKYVYNLTFTPVVNNPVRMAHIVSDSIIYHLTGFPGIALTKILYISKNSGKKSINVCDYDGRNDRTIFAPDFLVNFPRWISNNKIIYLSYRTGFPFLFYLGI